MPSDVLLSTGIPNLPLELVASRLVDKSMQDNHPFRIEEVKNLPISIHNPLAVFRSATHIGSYVILTELRHGNRSFVAAIEANKQVGRLTVNSIRSVHYRTGLNIVNWINEGLGEYYNPNFVENWLEPLKNELRSKPQYNSVDVRAKLNFAVKLVKDIDNPELLGENFADKEENTMHREDDGRILFMSQDKNYSRKQRALDIVNGENATLSKAKKRAAETATLSETSDAPLTVVSTADGAKVLNNLDKLTKHYDNLTTNNRTSFLMRKKGGEAIGALSHPAIGEIDLVWGKEGTGKSDGYGLAKLVKYHPEVLDNLQELLSEMEVVSRSENRINLESKTHRAGVRLDWDGERKTWLMTMFEKKETSEPAIERTDTNGNLKGSESDTALLQSSDVSSASKVTNNSANVQEKEQEKEEKTTEESLKQFLGDWEKDPENATKVVDDKGQSIVVYCGGGRLGNIEDASSNAMV